MRAVDVLETLELLGAHQHGLVTAAQAQEAGVSKMALTRMTKSGTLERVRHGVYALPSAQGDRHGDLRAAWMAAGATERIVVSGESAAALHGLGDVLPSKHEFTTPLRKQTSQPDVRYRMRDLADRDVVWVGGVPVTSVAHTVADLAEGGTDFDHLAAVVRDAVDAPGVTPSSLAEALNATAFKFHYPDGVELLAALLESTGYAPDTTLTDRLSSKRSSGDAALEFAGSKLNSILRRARMSGT